MKKNHIGIVKNIEKLTQSVFKLEIESGLKSAVSGQFISILCPNTTLRRPFSIADFENNIVTVLIKMVGDGTNYLSTLKKGDRVDFLAPLGNGFEIVENKRALLVGAGIGIAPMLFLKKELDKKNTFNWLISGFNSKEEVIQGSDEVTIGGSVLDRLDNLVKEKNIEIIYSCGPKPVLKGVSEIALKNNIVSELAMERVMACGIGVCRGCVIKLVKEQEIVLASICKDGPVFLGNEIIWD